MAKKKAAAKKRAKPAGPDLSHIDEPLRQMAVRVDSLTLDPRNANEHNEQSVATIAASLREFGQTKPIIAQKPDEDGGDIIVRCGNGTLRAAILNGWTHIACNVREMDDRTATALGIADNRSAELSEWDDEQLQSLLEEFDADGQLFGDPELQAMSTELTLMLEELGDETPAAEVAENPKPAKEVKPPESGFHVLITCDSDAAQRQLIAELTDAGHNVKAYTI